MIEPVKVRDVELGAGVPKTIVPIVAKTRQAILEKAREITSLPADLVEWRADFYEDLFSIPELFETMKGLRETLGNTPILFTIRTKPEGGEVEPDFDEYMVANLAAAQSRYVDLVDVEMFWGETNWYDHDVSEEVSRLIKGIHKAGCLVVGSRHNFLETPDSNELLSTLRAQQAGGADIPKIAVMPRKNRDVASLIDASVEMLEDYADRPFITISMGPQGMISRAACELSGSCMTFGAAGQSSAPGQIQVKDLKDMLTLIHTAQAGA